ncbi:uncharacterized protein TRAVEDRAFT_52824 [Trametes versicolor FP-101664 SS1]|uniref:uncharacterized protein n=1 Tax=Trametes versicolor (strain FP-101664) TaxID=717944 RepID=UPI00046235F2|nr:uncharacterized protein TRAVEDRAFT_52824 [Trametes versicolor FP-101664 SS1]EIW53704.1 hypothetical protein TRAVEDRAFT_52824 [Trametes versicolor FP-101664 SS1]
MYGRQDDDEEGEPLEPNWPDAVFSWCMRLQERTDIAKMEQDRTTTIRSRIGGIAGRWFPLHAKPESRTRNEHVLTPSDPADARAALRLSKRSVCTLSFRRRSDETSGEDVTCIGCSRGDDGSELGQCDECQTWYHLRCVGFKTIGELGREEDPWYCDRCLNILPALPLPEPTFVPTDDRPSAPISRRDSLFLRNPLLLESPAPHLDSDTGAGTPRTPVRGGDGDTSNANRTFSTRSSWGDSSRAGPSTPDSESSAKAVRVYHTPGPFALERDQLDPETPFDPTTSARVFPTVVQTALCPS